MKKTNSKKKRKWILPVAGLCLLIAIVLIIKWLHWENTGLEVHAYTIESDMLPSAFDGFRIAHVSDLHNTEIGKDHATLIKRIREANPDMIAIAGDLIDCRTPNVEVALRFVEQAMEIAPCYYVTGNHEGRLGVEYEELKRGLQDLGAIILEEESIHIERNGALLQVLGVNDPVFYKQISNENAAVWMQTRLEELKEEGVFSVLLSHRPELFDVYVACDIDLALTGHAHGGQFRLPFLGGVVVPNQGFFPEYDEGLHIEDNTHMLISRGIGNSIVPIRLNNRPELLVIELSKKTE